MNTKNFSAFILAFSLISLMFHFSRLIALNDPQNRLFVHYIVTDMSGWYYMGESTSGDSYVFQNNSRSTIVNLIKNPLQCENTQEFNRVLLSLT